jgi:excisionase family DNA binding protein
MNAEARPKPLMSVSEAARELGIAPTTAYEWLRRNELPGAVQLGGRWYVRRALLSAFVQGADMLPADNEPARLRHDDARHGGRAAGEGR